MMKRELRSRARTGRTLSRPEDIVKRKVRRFHQTVIKPPADCQPMEIARETRATDLAAGSSFLLALGLAVALCFTGIGGHALWSPDEPTGAAVGRAMLESGDLIVPRLNGEPFLEKPPLYWWTQVAVFRLFGASDTTARIPSALFGVLGLLTAWALGRRWGTARQGLLAVCVLGTTLLPCLLSFSLLVVPWAVALQRADGWAGLRECLLSNTAGRFFATARMRRYGHAQPFYYYLEVGPPLLLPWILALPAMLRAGAFRGGERGGETRRLLLASAGLGALLLSAAATKREIYLLPLLPAWSAAVAWWLAGVAERGPGGAWDRRTLKALAGFAVLLPLLLGAALLAVAWIPWASRRLAVLGGSEPPSRLVVYALSALALGVLVAVFLAHGPGEGPRGVRLAAALALVSLGLETGLMVLTDPVKRMSEMTAAVAANFPGTGPIPAYLPEGSNESIYGILGFELGRRTLALRTPDELAAWLRAHPSSPVLFRMKQARRLPASLLRELHFAYDETGRKASPFGIATAAGPEIVISKTPSQSRASFVKPRSSQRAATRLSPKPTWRPSERAASRRQKRSKMNGSSSGVRSAVGLERLILNRPSKAVPTQEIRPPGEL
jgi:4-amino-4-deoxy-L-arabinose transferase-like glycosyltransferase